jgi:hypothetical protein
MEEMVEVQEGMVQRLINQFKRAFDLLGVQVELVALEDLAVLIYKGMSVQARNYHNLDHVFNLVDEDSPIITLAALFHDLVYCQVDLGFLPQIHNIISPYILEKDGQIWIADQAGHREKLVQITLQVFDFSPGQLLSPSAGLNEFLSALVMIKKLEGILAEKELLKLLLCIEASIPFRDSAITGEDHFYVLEKRASKIDQHWLFGMGPTGVQNGVKLAVLFANHDVDSFAEPDVSCYLETTWKLLPELNVHLRSIDFYSIREYRQALQAMDASMSRLQAEKVFHQYRGVPADEVYQRMVAQARQNIETAKEYLCVKLLTQAILEALAEETGGDAPLSLFMGDLPHEGSRPRRLEDFLPEFKAPDWVDKTSPVYQLLADGRSGDTNFDLRTAPLSLFVYSSLTPQELRLKLSLAKEMFAGRLKASEFLAKMDPEILSAIAEASAKMAYTRRKQLLQFVL